MALKRPGLRGQSPNMPDDPTRIGIPARPFLYTLDQIAVLLNVEVRTVKQRYIYFIGRSTGMMRRDLMQARNIAPLDETPDWRVAEREMLRWFKYKGYRVYETGVVTN